MSAKIMKIIIMEQCKTHLLSKFTLVLVLLCSVAFSTACNVNQTGKIGANQYKVLPQGGRLPNTGIFLKSQVTELGQEPVSDGQPNHGDPAALTVNPHLEVLDEQFSKCGGIDIREISVLDIQTLYDANQLTVVKLTKCYLERLDRMNEVLRVVVEANPDALNEALRLDLERKSGLSRGGMHGIPVLLKDSVGTLDLTETTIGSPALIGIRPKNDADVVTSLRKAGALILGKSHSTEFYGFRGTNVPPGWSGRGGQSRNAYNLSVTPLGSSSGSAIGVAANLVPVAIGTETAGSILNPAHILGIVGMKPTHGLPSFKGTIPLSFSQDNIGPMAKIVVDTAILLDGMISETERPSYHPASYGHELLQNKMTRPFRIGVPRFPFWDLSVIDSVNLRYQLPQLEKIIQMMKNSPKFVMMDPVEPSFRNISTSKMYTMLYHETKHNFNDYLNTDVISNHPLPARPHNPFIQTPEAYTSVIDSTRKTIASLEDVIKYNREHPTTQGYNQEYLIRSQATDGILNETYIDARDSNRISAREYLESVFDQHNLDAIVTPNEFRIEGILRNNLTDFPVYGNIIACISGYPSINIPAGIGLNEVPFGIMFIAKPYEEPILLQVAYAAEQMSPKRRTPKFLI